jgi:short-subunit dehydrogenase
MAIDLTNLKIIVTGATGGIGGAIATALAEQGCSLLITGRNIDKLNVLYNGLDGAEHYKIAADLTTSVGRQSLVEAAERFNATVLINAMGINQLALLEDMSDTEISAMMATNVVAPIQLTRQLLNQLCNQQQAFIVNIGSILGSIGYAGSTTYCASKSALKGFSQALRRELADTTVKVIYFAPRATDTELNSQQMKQLNNALNNTVDDVSVVANKLVFAIAQGKSKDIYIGQSESFFVRLNFLFPRLVDAALNKQLPIIKRLARS